MLLFVGIWEIIAAFGLKETDSIWWVRLVTGMIAVLLVLQGLW
jgi:hypothetical protein